MHGRRKIQQGTLTKRAFRVALLSACVLGFMSQAIIASSISGSWSQQVTASDLSAGPGSDLLSAYESGTSQVTIAVTQTGGWSVSVHKVDNNWHANLNLYLRRTSNGSGSGSIADGGDYQQLTSTSTAFFSGSALRTNIHVQIKIDGVSVLVPQGDYATTVHYTFSDT